jgi:hypothetical protein
MSDWAPVEENDPSLIDFSATAFHTSSWATPGRNGAAASRSALRRRSSG